MQAGGTLFLTTSTSIPYLWMPVNGLQATAVKPNHRHKLMLVVCSQRSRHGLDVFLRKSYEPIHHDAQEVSFSAKLAAAPGYMPEL